MTASPSSTNESIPRDQSSVSPISTFPSKVRLEVISSQGQLKVYSSPYRGIFSDVPSGALRSAGLGSKVLIVEFLKGGVAQGPSQSIRLCRHLEWVRPNIYGSINTIDKSNVAKSEDFLANKLAIQEIWEICQKHLTNNSLDKLVLDEIGLAIELGFIPLEDFLNALENRHNAIDVIITGPSIPTKVFAMADQVTQLRT